MALIKFGAGIVDARGSIAGQVFSRNRFGAYIRARVVPVNPATQRQQDARASMSAVVAAWKQDLTAEQRGQWEAYAAVVGWTNKLGETQHLTGFNMFVRSNMLRIMAGGAIVENGPTILLLPETDPSIVATVTADDQKISLAYDDEAPWAGEVGGHLLVFVGTPQNDTRNFYKGPYRYCGKQNGATSPPAVRLFWTLVSQCKPIKNYLCSAES